MFLPSSEYIGSNGHTTHYLRAGPEDGLTLVFVHGWPELSLSWCHQLPVFANLGFRVIAPDMRGYGRSTVYSRHIDYRQRLIVADMIALVDALECDKAVWIGHDWGSAVVWNIASHHPERCEGVISLCVPYHTIEYGLESCLGLLDREIYPEAEFPLGQWEYQGFYEENFARATQVMNANPYNMAKAIFRKGNPKDRGRPAVTAFVRKNHGWFGGADEPPEIAHDVDVVTLEELEQYASALKDNGFFAPNAYYMNHEANAKYAHEALHDGYLAMPVLFLAARYDYTCETIESRLAEPMRQYCNDLTEKIVDSGHWMAQEKPREVNATLAKWLVEALPQYWPKVN